MISDLEIAEAEAGSNDPLLTSPWYSGENNWHPPYWLKNEASLTMKYIHSFFWGAGMVTSLVPRDIEPLTVMESIVTTTTMFFGLLLNAFVISSLNQALASMNSKKELTGKQLGEIKNYLILKEIPSKLRSRVMEYYEYLLGSSAALENLNMFENLPAALSAQLALSTNRRLAAKCAFFHTISNSSMITLIEELKALVFIPSQMITRQGALVKAVYFINRGIVQISTHDSMQPTLTNTDNFGFDDFFAGCVAKTKPQVSQTAQAVTYCDLMSLELESLEKALNKDKKFRDGIEEARRNARAAHKAAYTAQKRNLSPSEPKGSTALSKRFSPGVRGGFKWPTMSDLKYLKSRAANGGSARSPPPISEKEREKRALVNLAKKINAEEVEALEHNTGTGESSGSSDGRAYGNGRLSPSKRSSLRAVLLRAAARLMAGEDLRGSPPPIVDHPRRRPSLKSGIRGGDGSNGGVGSNGSSGGGGSNGGNGDGGGDGGNGGSGDGGSGDAALAIATAGLSGALAGTSTGASPVAVVAEPPSASGGGRDPGKLHHPLAQRTPVPSLRSRDEDYAAAGKLHHPHSQRTPVPSLRSRDEDYAADVLASARNSVTGDGSARSGDASARSRPGKLSARGSALSAFETREPGELSCRSPTAFAPTPPATATAALPGCEDASSSTHRPPKGVATRSPPKGYGSSENATGGGTPPADGEGGGSSGGTAGLHYLPRPAVLLPAASTVRSPSAFARSSTSAWDA